MSSVVARVRGLDHFLLVARLSLVLLIVNVNRSPVLLVFAALVTVVLFPRPELLRRPWPWLGIAAVVGTAQLLEWWLIDDHVVVTTYWLLGIGLSRLGDDRDRVLGQTARLLIGLVFAFAFGWKLLSSQFISTDFFRYQFLTDDRFRLVAEIAGGTDPDVIAGNDDAVEIIGSETRPGGVARLVEGPRNELVAAVFTYWGLVIEGAIAAAFLLPLRGRARILRPVTLFLFAFTTYLVVPVAGFGALLMVLGLAERDSDVLRVAYVGSFVALLVWGGIFPLLI